MPRPLQFKSRLLTLVTLVFVFFGAVAVPFLVWFWFFLSPLQKQYFPTYMAAAMTGATGRTVPVWWIWKTGPKRKPELAADADVVSAAAVDSYGLSLALSPAARAGGWTGLMRAQQMGRTQHEAAVLQEEFFAGESLTRLIVTPFCGTAILFLLYLAFREKFGGQSKHKERHGRRTKGPELISTLRANLRGRAGGIQLRLTSKLGPLTPSFCIPRKLESSHILLMGDTGSGKSSAIRQILRQVQTRGETAIVYDPAGEFVQEFYKPERGDLILNPLDERCPYWDLRAELLYGGIADAIAAAMLLEKEFENKFFTYAPRRVLARLLNSRPSVQQLLAWMANPSEIERRLEGTPQAAYLDKAAGPQRAGTSAASLAFAQTPPNKSRFRPILTNETSLSCSSSN